MSTYDELARDVMVGIGICGPLWETITHDDCTHERLSEPRIVASVNITPFVKFLLDQGWNKRTGFRHLHSGEVECGMAYVNHGVMFHDGKTVWAPCSKLLNHEGPCGYQDNTPY